VFCPTVSTSRNSLPCTNSRTFMRYPSRRLTSLFEDTFTATMTLILKTLFTCSPPDDMNSVTRVSTCSLNLSPVSSVQARHRMQTAMLTRASYAGLNHKLQKSGSKTTVVAFIIMPAATNSYTIEALKGQAVMKQLRDTVTEVQHRIGDRIFEHASRYHGYIL
jgi:hypothetical protein